MLPRPSAGDQRRAEPISYYKAGTIERIVRWRGDADGHLAALAKLLAITLLSYAPASSTATVTISDAELSADLHLDPKTLRKHMQQLVDRGLLSFDRRRETGVRRFSLDKLYQRFGEAKVDAKSKVTRIGNFSRSDDFGSVDSSGMSGSDGGASRENFPNSTKGTYSFSYISEAATRLDIPEASLRRALDVVGAAVVSSVLRALGVRSTGEAVSDAFDAAIASAEAAQRVWSAIVEQASARGFSDPVIGAVLRPMFGLRADSGKLVLVAPNRFVAERVPRRQVHALLVSVGYSDLEIEIDDP